MHDEPQIEGLKPGAKLLRGQYEILRFLSNGGFGITYLARDSLNRDVVIKECFPGALCRRNGDQVEPADPGHKQDLRAIIDLFIQEARNHARLVHPNIVDVHQVFEDNNTAYIAMDLIRGCDLLDYLDNPENEGGTDFIVQVTEKMLSAVSFIHQSGMLHRDISPDNILINEHDEPVLIDFGAAREQAANTSAALLTLRVIKDGYSPHEFYVRGAEQGPSSDLYVLAATLYHAISGERPIDGQSRLNAFNSGHPDPYKPLTGRYFGYPPGFLEAIDKAMEVHTPARLQSALDWLRMFRGPDVMFDSFAYRPVSVIVGMDRKDTEVEKARVKAESENAEAVVTALLAGNPDIALGSQKQDSKKSPEKQDPPVAVDTIVQSGSSGGSKALLLTGVALIALAAGAYFVMSGDKAAPETSTETNDTAIPQQTIAETDASPVETEESEQNAAEQTALDLNAENESTQDQPIEQVEAESEPGPVIASDTEQAAAALPEPVEASAESELPVVIKEPVPLAENQVAYAHWDVEVPFDTSLRRASTGNVVAIRAVDDDLDLSMIGEWIKRGTTIFTINGSPVRPDASLAAHVLGSAPVDPDGYIRVAVRYRSLGDTRAQNGLLALPGVRVLGLESGYAFEIRATDDAKWQTVVTNVPEESAGDLRRGDILIHEAQTDTALEASESLDAVLSGLVSRNAPEAQLNVLRNGAETAATLRLVEE